MKSRNRWMFAVLCAIWGSTWIGVKAGIDVVPPLLFAGSRFTAAGLVLLAITAMREGWTVRWNDAGRIIASSLLTIALCYGALFWGMQFIDSGTSAVLDLGLTPIALLVFAVISRDERATLRKGAAVVIGIIGLILLFGQETWTAWQGADAQAGQRLVGAAAVAASAMSYGWGSVLARPLLTKYPTTLVSGLTTVIGGTVLLAASATFEPRFGEAIRGAWGWKAWGGWAFLVVFGSLIAYSLYMVLLRDIGASRAGMYAFVSPVIAVLLGAVLRHEQITGLSLLGMGVLLLASWIAIRGDSSGEPFGSRAPPPGDPRHSAASPRPLAR